MIRSVPMQTFRRKTYRRGPSLTLTVILLSLATASCGKDKTEGEHQADVEETGIDITRNPLGAIGQLAKAGQKLQEKAKKLEQHEPVEPVHFNTLVEMLPKETGWESKNEPNGETNQMGEFRISTASQNYEKEIEIEGKKMRQRMTVKIVDGSYLPMVYAPFLMMSQFSKESTSGHAKGIEVDGYPAFEEWKKSGRKITLSVLIEDRFLVTIEGRQVEVGTARDWLSHIDLKKLATMAKDGEKGTANKGVEKVDTRK